MRDCRTQIQTCVRLAKGDQMSGIRSIRLGICLATSNFCTACVLVHSNQFSLFLSLYQTSDNANDGISQSELWRCESTDICNLTIYLYIFENRNSCHYFGAVFIWLYYVYWPLSRTALSTLLPRRLSRFVYCPDFYLARGVVHSQTITRLMQIIDS